MNDDQNSGGREVGRGEEVSGDEVSQTVDHPEAQTLVDGAERQGHDLCKQPVPFTSSPLRPIGGSVQVTRSASGETDRNFERWTEGMIKTRATQTVLDKISQSRTWITITGSPGEGKTTAGYLVLKHLHSMGRQVYDIKTPEDYFKVKQDKQAVIMLNDIFGFRRFDSIKISKWKEVLNDVLGMKEHTKADNMYTDASNSMKPELTAILVSRSSVLKEASHHLSRFRDLILKKDCVVDFTHGFDISEEERMKIWKSNSRGYNIDISDNIINEVCTVATPHGFPHCCRLFAALYSKNKYLDMKSFFFNPMKFLNQTMESLMMDSVTGSLLRDMLRNDGSLDLDSVTDDEQQFQYTSVAETLTDAYLSHDRCTVTFHHASVYDNAAFVVCKKDPLFVITHCSLSFLNERVILCDLESGSEEDKENKVEISNKYIPAFVDRLKYELEKDNLSLVLFNQSLHDSGFVAQFMKCILPSSDVQPLSDSVRHLFHRNDKLSKESFLYLMTKSRSDRVLRYICQVVQLSQEDQAEVVFGICEHSSAASLDYFLKINNDFDLNLRNSNLLTPLLVASKRSKGRILKLLLERDVDVSITDKGGISVLQHICKHGVDDDVDVVVIVKILVEKGANVNEGSLGYHSQHLPLHIACYEGHTNVVKALLQCGADVNLNNTYDSTPLIYAGIMNHIDVVNVLLERGADIKSTNSYGDTLLLRSCQWGHVDVVTAFLDRGVDINKTNSGGDTPLLRAAFKGHVDVVTVLLDREANINKTNSGNDTPLHYACCRGHVEVVTVLLDRGADINIADSDGEIPLHAACYMGFVNVVTVLVDRGADMNKASMDGNTPLHTAFDEEHVDVVKVLLDRGANINMTNRYGDTPLHRACYQRLIDVVKVLLNKGADINKMNSDGNTSLHSACFGGHVDVATVLLDRGADINKTNKKGQTPLLYLSGISPT